MNYNNEKEAAEAYTAVFNEINWLKVRLELENIINIPLHKIKFEQRGTYGRYVNIANSPNLIKNCGLFSLAIAECYINFFSNSLFINEDSTDLLFWGTVHLTYPGNGQIIAELRILKDGTIKSEITKPKEF